jgi:hypothetical protein
MSLILIYIVSIFILVYWVENDIRFLSKFLILNKSNASQLEDWLKKFNWNKQELSSSFQLPRYKFYSSVIEVLLELARKKGGKFNEGLLFLRSGLQNDIQFEKRVKELLKGVWLQMSLMFVMIWIFILSCIQMTQIDFSTSSLLGILMWQMLALLVLFSVLKWLRKYYFNDIGKMWKILHILKALGHAPLARSEIYQLAGLSDLNTLTQKNLLPLSEKLQETCTQALKIGGNYLDEINSLMKELRFQENWHFELFEKRLSALKLSLLSLFFLPSYLFFIFLLMEKLVKDI